MSYKEGTLRFWMRINRTPNWLKDRYEYTLFDDRIGDAMVKIQKISQMKLYVEHYHPLTYFRTLSYDLNGIDKNKDHQIALTWDPTELILYIDGKCAARIESKLEAIVN